MFNRNETRMILWSIICNELLVEDAPAKEDIDKETLIKRDACTDRYVGVKEGSLFSGRPHSAVNVMTPVTALRACHHPQVSSRTEF